MSKLTTPISKRNEEIKNVIKLKLGSSFVTYTKLYRDVMQRSSNANISGRYVKFYGILNTKSVSLDEFVLECDTLLKRHNAEVKIVYGDSGYMSLQVFNT